MVHACNSVGLVPTCARGTFRSEKSIVRMGVLSPALNSRC